MPITTYQGGKFDDRTLAMYHEAERLLPFDVFVSQGGFNAGGVAASAGTHDRAAVDVAGSLLTPAERTQVETMLRRVGFAAWVRTPAQGFTSYHIHGVPINGDTSPAARAQAVSYLNGRNGLASNGPDTGTRAYVDVTWESYSNTSAYRPPVDFGDDNNTGDDMPSVDDLLNAAIPRMGPKGPTGGATSLRATAAYMDSNLDELRALVKAAADPNEVHATVLGITRSDEFKRALRDAVLDIVRSDEFKAELR